MNFQWEDDEPYDGSFVAEPEYLDEDDHPRNYTLESEFEQVKTLAGTLFEKHAWKGY